ncbi:polysaccharide deacetylase family protein [Paenibacillus endoradicis]|uniref:polysaccharide deacetylase family protein n=1 Tax=Paenibacillus endoradicis TaxID=2972487 RepID=UPI002158CA56|nr:polysaccharide deacetylase family protein [Paenibacillus endoradicis]MCR8655780.1 polysaccharide deacetylase family protein [Paenibacillus endoradicis]MCR8658106.1 polysaccharide deacetylase family protein [Paenibacillus endoradicis]
MENILTWGFYFMTFYAFIPGLLSRVFGYQVFKKGKANHEIALTFDDGPDPIYTEQLLDLLQRYDAKATFFVVGVHAKQNPELLKRMRDEGHTIGVHNYEHKTNWFMRPKTVRKHIAMTNDIIEEVTGQRSIYYRPPWGIVNLFDYGNVSRLNIILWSSIFGDWHKKLDAKKLEVRLMSKLNAGEVLLLHDCGRTFGADVDAPRNMLIALEVFLEEATLRQMKMVNIESMIKVTEHNNKKTLSIGKKMMVSLWLTWEKVFHQVMRLKDIKSSNGSMFHYRLIKYKGKPLPLNNGEVLSHGDQIVELHFDNKKLSQIAFASKNPLVVAVKTIREVERALPALALQITDEAKNTPIKAIQGITMINRGADKLGFSIHDMPNGIFLASSKIYLKWLMKILTPAQTATANRQVREQVQEEPRILLMTLERLQQYIPLDNVYNVAKQQEIISAKQDVLTSN